MNEEVVFSDILRALRKSFRKIILTIIIFLICGGAVGYWIPPVYEAELDVLINTSSTSTSSTVPTMGEIDTSLRLVETYKQVMKSDRVSSEVNMQLDGRYPKSEIRKKVKIESGNASQIITIVAKDNSAVDAAMLVNTFAHVFKDEIKQLMNLDNITIMTEVSAETDTTKVKPALFYYVLISILAGTLICITAILIKEIHFGAIDTIEKINTVLQLPLIGMIKKSKQRFEMVDSFNKRENIYTRSSQNDFGMLVANVLHEMKRNDMKALLVTSSTQGEGKSFIASHLAAAIANGENKTVFVDANFRRPAGTVIFNILERKGVSSVISGFYTIAEVQMTTQQEYLTFIGTGPLPPESSTLLQSEKWGTFIENLKANHDFIIIDATEASLPDSHFLLPNIDGVLFVLDSRKPSKKHVKNSVQAIRKLDGNIIGVVMNGHIV